jgi:Phage integrase, N-terminal SAM-like domain
MALGEFDGHEPGAIPSSGKADWRAPAKTPLRLAELVEAWVAERHPAPKTAYEWRRAILQFRDFLGWDDALRVTPEHVRKWKADLVKSGRATKTIRDSKLAPLRAVLQWAVDEGRLPSNPAERVSIDVKSQPTGSKRSFTDEEAALVLTAAARESDPVRRWVPWLCAYSGARIGEVCQLRVVDILVIEGVWCMKFDPAAGPLKTQGSERAGTLHPAVVGGAPREKFSSCNPTGTPSRCIRRSCTESAESSVPPGSGRQVSFQNSLRANSTKFTVVGNTKPT